MLNLIVFAYDAIRLKFKLFSDPVTEKYGDVTKLIYPNLSGKEQLDLALETWRDRPFEYEPFTQFKERPFKGNYVNVDPNGFRITSDQGPWPLKNDDFNIFLFGGSTTFNYGLPDDETIASFMQRRLNRVSTQRKVNVYNFGRGFYTSAQERILFEKLLSEGHIPEMAIFIDGINEIQNLYTGPKFTGELRDAMDESNGWLISKILRKLPATKYLWLQMNVWQHEKNQKNIQPQDSNEKTRADSRLFVITELANYYLHNKQLTQAAADAYGVQSVFVWQPSPYYGYDLAYHPFANPNKPENLITKNLYELMANLVDAGNLGNNFIYLADMQRDKPVPLYVDAIHYSAAMSQTIADSIAQLMFKQNLVPSSLNTTTDDLVAKLLSSPQVP